jgi:hypothetical protein
VRSDEIILCPVPINPYFFLQQILLHKLERAVNFDLRPDAGRPVDDGADADSFCAESDSSNQSAAALSSNSLRSDQCRATKKGLTELEWSESRRGVAALHSRTWLAKILQPSRIGWFDGR